MSNNLYAYQVRRYLLMSVDPVHIGAGGARLGRVDNSIIREPGTKLPKIPGTSLSGAIRAYAAYRNGTPDCAGQKSPHTKPEDCPVCYTFGVANDVDTGFRGTVSIGDARLLLFPVHSLQGPVWVTSTMTLNDAGFSSPPTPENTKALFSSAIQGAYLNLNWVMVEKGGNLKIKELPKEILEAVRSRIILVSEKLFSQVVNSGLEVRTSVSINPQTGAAEDKALFTYEAIPRATYFWMDIVEDDFRKDFPVTNEWHTPLDVVDAGLVWAEHLGVGGMGTRGFGRIHFRTPHDQNAGSASRTGCICHVAVPLLAQ